MNSTPAADDGPTSALAAAAADWLSAIARALPQEKLEILHRRSSDPASEVSVRVEFKSKAVVLEVSDATGKTELVRMRVVDLGHSDERTIQSWPDVASRFSTEVIASIPAPAKRPVEPVRLGLCCIRQCGAWDCFGMAFRVAVFASIIRIYAKSRCSRYGTPRNNRAQLDGASCA